MNNIADQITIQLQALVGLKLSIARRAADMLVLHFGTIREVESRSLSGRKKDAKKGTVGDYALHIQCAWRLFRPGTEGNHLVISGGQIEESP